MIQFVGLLGTMAAKLGVPKRALWKELPFSDDTIKEWEEMAEEQAATAPPIPQAPEEEAENEADEDGEERAVRAAA